MADPTAPPFDKKKTRFKRLLKLARRVANFPGEKGERKTANDSLPGAQRPPSSESSSSMSVGLFLAGLCGCHHSGNRVPSHQPDPESNDGQMR